jgi:hypothetical protein
VVVRNCNCFKARARRMAACRTSPGESPLRATALHGATCGLAMRVKLLMRCLLLYLCSTVRWKELDPVSILLALYFFHLGDLFWSPWFTRSSLNFSYAPSFVANKKISSFLHFVSC